MISLLVFANVPITVVIARRISQEIRHGNLLAVGSERNFPEIATGFALAMTQEETAQPSTSSSSSLMSWPKVSRALLTGSGVLMSTPAIFSRLMGSVEQPPDRNFR